MKPSQLRQAAELLLARDNEVRELFMRSHGKEAAPTTDYYLANHIIDTVLEDDAEPVTQDWITSFECAKYGVLDISDGVFCIQCYNDDSVWLTMDGSEVKLEHVKTRGDLRALCRLLGINLKEQA